MSQPGEDERVDVDDPQLLAVQRDRVLDAYIDIVVARGPETVTLEGVAGAAGVSQGGLLYHFGSREALLAGLLERAAELTEADIATGPETPDGLAAYYLRTSFDDPAADSDVFRVMVALYKLGATEPRTAEASRAVLARWRSELTADLGDPLTADWSPPSATGSTCARSSAIPARNSLVAATTSSPA